MANFQRDTDDARQNIEQLLLDACSYGRATIRDATEGDFVVLRGDMYAKMRRDLGMEPDPAVEKPYDLQMNDRVDRYAREEWQSPV